MEDIRRQKRKEGTFRRKKLLERFTAIELASQIRGMMRNIGQDWKEIGNIGRKEK